MKLLILVVAITCSSAAKLDNTYLPPRTAQTSGGSGNFLQAPFSGAQNGISKAGDSFQNDFVQKVNDFAQNGNGFTQNGNGFAQNGNGFAQNGNGFAQTNGFNQQRNDQFSGFEARPERPQAAFERNAAILRQDNQNDGETYSYAYETENGIVAEENGVATNGVEAQGGFSYTGDDGQVYSIRYTADQNGFVPQGDHLPTPPPIPEEILKALEQNARDEAAGIFDDGSYNAAKYGSGDEYKSTNNYNTGFNSFNTNTFSSQGENLGDEDSVVTNSALFRNQNQGFDNGAANQGFNTEALVGGQTNKAYLPPVASRRTASQSFGSRSRPQSFSARNGYKY